MKKIVEVGIVLVVLLIIATTVSALMDPYAMGGYVQYGNGTGVVGANVTFTDQSTSEVIYFTSVTNGAYSQNALNFPSEYSDGDIIQYYTVLGEYTNTTSHTINVSGDGGGNTMNIILSSATLNPATALNLSVRGEYDLCYDVSGDGCITSLDALMILQTLTPFECTDDLANINSV